MKRKANEPQTEHASAKSAAEFFSEHQQIAGFDNSGKSLFTTIRELVENSLDAAESANILVITIHLYYFQFKVLIATWKPEIHVTITEYSEGEHNTQHGISSSKADAPAAAEDEEFGAAPYAESSQKTTKKKEKDVKSSDVKYYMVQCRDNGCGIEHSQVRGKYYC